MDELFEQERVARLAKNEGEIKEIFFKMLSHCTTDNEVILIAKQLSRKKGQLRAPFSNFIRHIFETKKEYFLSKNEKPRFIEFLKTFLKDVVEGKLFLEEERLMMADELKNLYLECGDLQNAMTSIFDIPVETFSSVSERRIISFQLLQFNLALENLDLIKADICCKKIRRRYFNETGDSELEGIFDELLLKLSLGQKEYLESSRIFLKMCEKKNSLKSASFYALIGGADSEMISSLISHKNNSDDVRCVLSQFLKNELVKPKVMEIFPECEKHTKEVILCVDTHNLKIISQYCTTVTLEDLKFLLNSGEVVEKVCHAVNRKTLNCKIDQTKQVVVFNRKMKDDWIERIDAVLDKILEANSLIHKENLK